jgi:hypothetical protein
MNHPNVLWIEGIAPRFIRMLYGVQVDGQREHVGVFEPGSRIHRPFGAGE